MKWIASLSNGETRVEADQNGGDSPWQSLLHFLQDHPDISITQMRLQHNDITAVSIPNSQGYVQCGRMIASGVVSGNPVAKYFRGIGAIIGNAVFMIWVSEDDKSLVYQSIESLEGLSLHAWHQALVSA